MDLDTFDGVHSGDDLEEQQQESTVNNSNAIKIIDIDVNSPNDQRGRKNSDSMSIDDRLIKKNKDHYEHTTDAFLELLQLDTMTRHLQEMRDRRMFLEKAANDEALPVEERQIAAWISNNYLSSTSTTIYPQQIIDNIIKHKQHKNDKNDNNQSNHLKEDREEEQALNDSKLSQIICQIDSRLNNDKTLSLLSSINEWNFSVFEFVNICGHNSLSLLMTTICTSRSILSALNVPMDTLINYMNLVDVNYKNNPYHNNIHAADVLLNVYYFMRSSLFSDNINILDCFAILISASVHDVGHPGHGNSFEIATESQLAITYNDQSVLENMHISLAWKLLKRQSSNILCNMTKTQRKRFRKVVIESVLATDMSQHSLHSETLEKLVEKYGDLQSQPIEENNLAAFSDQFLPIALHTADLGNLCKEIKYYNEWVDRLMNEFFNQGDKERELGIEPISFLCDRFKVNIHSGQVGFINFVIRPWFTKFGRLLNEDSHNKLFLHLLNENLKYMQERAKQTKDAQEEIKKNEKQQVPNQQCDENMDDADVLDDDEMADKVKPLTMAKPKIIDIEALDQKDSVLNSRTSKSYSIIAMSFPEIRSKLAEYQNKNNISEMV